MMKLNMIKPNMILLPLRGLQLFLSFVVLGLSAYVANWYNVDTLTSSPTQINFLIIAAIYSIISVIYLEGAPRFLPRIVAHPVAAMVVELINVLFYFGGMIALAVFLNSLLFCRGAVCGAARADAGISGLMWLLFTATAVINGLDTFKSGLRRPTRAGLKGPYPKEMKETSVA